jgi:hypothetical protein
MYLGKYSIGLKQQSLVEMVAFMLNDIMTLCMKGKALLSLSKIRKSSGRDIASTRFFVRLLL